MFLLPSGTIRKVLPLRQSSYKALAYEVITCCTLLRQKGLHRKEEKRPIQKDVVSNEEDGSEAHASVVFFLDLLYAKFRSSSASCVRFFVFLISSTIMYVSVAMSSSDGRVSRFVTTLASSGEVFVSNRLKSDSLMDL